MGITIRGLGGLFFKATDKKALGAWYEEHLGLASDEYGAVVLGWRELGDAAQVRQTVWSPFSADTDYFAPSEASWMANFIVEDLDAALAAVAAGGGTLVGEPQEFEYGRFGWFLDPENNKVELWQPAEGYLFDTTVPAGTNELEGQWLCEPGTTIATTGAGESPKRIVKTATVSKTPEELWPLWTTSEGMAKWLIPHSTIELRIGGPYELYFLADNPPGTRGGDGNKVLAFVEPRLLAFTWNAPPELAYTRPRLTQVVVEFDTGSDGTRVTLTHSGFPSADSDPHQEWPETFAYFDSAWDRVMGALQAHCN